MNNENLRPFGALPPEEQRALSRRGGVASGARRRERAALRLALLEHMAGFSLAGEVRTDYRRAVRRCAAARARRRGRAGKRSRTG